MTFSAEELRVLRGALAAAGRSHPPAAPPAAAESLEYAGLAAAVEETLQESDRLRSFQLADLARYRSALPGAAAGYLEQLSDALADGYLPRPDDLDALRGLPALAVGAAEADRRRVLLRRCERLAAPAVPLRPAAPAAPAAPAGLAAPAVMA